MSKIKLTFPDDSVKEFDEGTTTLDVAKSISTSLGKKAVAGKLNDTLVDLERPIKQDAKIEIISGEDKEDALKVLRNTAALVFSAAAKSFKKDLHFGEKQANDDGFYVDTDSKEGQISVDELKEIKALMNKIIKNNDKIERSMMDKDKLVEMFKDDPYKSSLIGAIESVQIPVYTLDGFVDFGYDAVLTNLKALKHFELLSVAGAYWQGKSSNPMLQRIYATAFYKEDGLEADLKRRAEIKERDHRTIGRDLDLFFVDPEVGAGLPYWMPNGATIRRVIERYIVDKEVAWGYQHVYTPILMNLNAYKTSGHWAHYREDMFPPMDMGDGEMLELRPMNCPSHIQIYKHHNRSYRDLPLRIAELGMMHRYEKSGALSGLQRVREMTLNDGHTFVALDQIQEEFKRTLQLMVEVYKDFDINDYTFRLSYRDPANTEKYFDDDEMWNRSQSMLKAAMDDLGLKYYEAEGEAAFYGPKLDVQTKTALGNEETLSTIQLDFMQPEKFQLTYVGSDGEDHRPVMIHRGIVSTMERFIAYLIEIYKGAFPTWLAPTQVRIIPVNQKLHTEYANEVLSELRAKNIRAEIDDRDEKMGYKIRDSQTMKIPYTVVIGDEEAKNATVSVRKYGEDDSASENAKMFVSSVVADIANFSRKDVTDKSDNKD
ncbi:threonine--tRNA ligase [Companilactobacillus kimchii]|uniref:Threonine--tRNA ligase n=2 Tax=Companilactobacillus kimchii TaxID=2801452 RepID=A0ABR5NQN4_9LACO|nr:threonine--tRNA ligase [Companilactobacillus kimchii]KAE9562898.1 threonine--tRNA ligase [Companilactobacillus kimchii]KRK49932.1 threonyl-tRNA synthetase [Companilactobacillus kimchii DSM 13961 = JCM 10707]OWF33097.1 Threonine--tRNA ligase [Companilactobacillus kimchii]GEO46818.1 threonine--tRNA ligase [Companilactobacillus paralimentarius]